MMLKIEEVNYVRCKISTTNISSMSRSFYAFIEHEIHLILLHRTVFHEEFTLGGYANAEYT